MSDLNVKELVETMEVVGIPTIVLVEPEPESPYLPGTNIRFAWDSTYLEYFKRCPRLYQYKAEGWTNKDENVHLRFGSEFHTSIQQYELLIADGLDHNECMFHLVKDLLQRTDDFRPDHKYKNRNFLVQAVIAYLDKYRDDPAKTHVFPDGKPAVELSFRLELEYGPTADQPYILCGHMDRIVEFNGALFDMDYKTTTSTPTDYYWKQFEPNNQMTLYTFASHVIFETPVQGVIINSIQIMIENAPRITRGVTYRTKGQMEEWLKDLREWLDKAQEYAENGYWPMNDTACDKFGGCPFRDVCSKSPEVRGKFLKSDFKQEKPWNPLEPR